MLDLWTVGLTGLSPEGGCLSPPFLTPTDTVMLIIQDVNMQVRYKIDMDGIISHSNQMTVFLYKMYLVNSVGTFLHAWHRSLATKLYVGLT